MDTTLNTWKNFDFNKSRNWKISTQKGEIEINDGEIIAIGLDLGGHNSNMMKLSIKSGANHYLVKKAYSSYSILFLQQIIFETLFIPSKCIQKEQIYVYIYTSERKEVTDILEIYMRLYGYSLEAKSYIPEIIRGERWIEYKFKALYQIESD